MQTNLDITNLVQRFWDPNVMSQWQDILQEEDLDTHFYLDFNNILRDRQTGQGVAYLGGVREKAEMGLQITNVLRQKTPSFQYIFGVIEPILRQDGLNIGGSLGELIAEDDIEDWLIAAQNGPNIELQLYSIIMQLCYAAYLLAQQGWDVRPALTGIKIREVIEDSTVPFFNGSIQTYGVIPVIYELEVLKALPDIDSKDVAIPHILDLIAGADLWSDNWEILKNSYDGMDISNGNAWNNLIGVEIYSTRSASFNCQGQRCITGPASLLANGKRIQSQDLQLLEATNLPLPDHIRPFALAFKSWLANLYPTEETFTLQEDINPELVQEYLNPNFIASTYSQLDDELQLLLADQNKGYRRLIRSDLEFGSLSNEFFVREDFIRPVLTGGDVYSFDKGTIIEGYNDETGIFTLRQDEDVPFQLGYEDLFDYLSRVEEVEPYTYRSIPRQNIAIINGQVSYHNRETGELYPLPEERIYVRNVGNMLQLVDNSHYLLGLAMSTLVE